MLLFGSLFELSDFILCDVEVESAMSSARLDVCAEFRTHILSRLRFATDPLVERGNEDNVDI